jgi:hypothetical protein
MLKLGFVWCLVLASVGAVSGGSGCAEVKNAYDCNHICNRYKDCFDANYDVGACEDRCKTHANNDTAYANKAEACQTCEDDASCAGAAFGCAGDCIGIVP